MAREVVEVVARFGDTLLDVRYVGPSDVYRIGTAPDVDLAVPGATSLPLVSGGQVHIPAGTPTTTRGKTTELELGHVSIAMTPIKVAHTYVARRRPDWRTPAFLFGSLIAHLGILVLAWTLEPFELLVVKQQPRLRYAHIATPPPLLDDKPVDQPEPRAATAPRAGRAAAAAPHHKGESGNQPFSREVMASIRRLADSSQLDDIGSGELYDEDEANAQGFGGRGRFDPDERKGFESVASGGYVTFSFDVKLCPDQSCRVSGPFPAQGVRSYLHAVLPAIYECYLHHATGPGTIVLEFTITRRSGGDGAVRDAKGHGLGETGECAAAVVASLDFKALDADTHVRYPIRFN